MQVSLISGLSSAAEEAAIPGSDVLYVDLAAHSADREPMTLREVFLRSFVLENIIVGEAMPEMTRSSPASLGSARDQPFAGSCPAFCPRHSLYEWDAW